MFKRPKNILLALSLVFCISASAQVIIKEHTEKEDELVRMVSAKDSGFFTIGLKKGDTLLIGRYNKEARKIFSKAIRIPAENYFATGNHAYQKQWIAQGEYLSLMVINDNLYLFLEGYKIEEHKKIAAVRVMCMDLNGNITKPLQLLENFKKIPVLIPSEDGSKLLAYLPREYDDVAYIGWIPVVSAKAKQVVDVYVIFDNNLKMMWTNTFEVKGDKISMKVLNNGNVYVICSSKYSTQVYVQSKDELKASILSIDGKQNVYAPKATLAVNDQKVTCGGLAFLRDSTDKKYNEKEQYFFIQHISPEGMLTVKNEYALSKVEGVTSIGKIERYFKKPIFVEIGPKKHRMKKELFPYVGEETMSIIDAPKGSFMLTQYSEEIRHSSTTTLYDSNIPNPDRTNSNPSNGIKITKPEVILGDVLAYETHYLLTDRYLTGHYFLDLHLSYFSKGKVEIFQIPMDQGAEKVGFSSTARFFRNNVCYFIYNISPYAYLDEKALKGPLYYKTPWYLEQNKSEATTVIVKISLEGEENKPKTEIRYMFNGAAGELIDVRNCQLIGQRLFYRIYNQKEKKYSLQYLDVNW